MQRDKRTASARLLLAALALIFSTLMPGISAAEEWIYTTRPGDTLWGISEKHLKGTAYTQRLQQYNAIDNAKLLPPGTLIRAPVEWLKQPPAPAVVSTVVGPVTLRAAAGATAAPLSAGAQLSTSAIIETGKGGSVTLTFADGSTLLLQENSVLILDALSAHRDTGMVDTRMRLQKGRVDTKVIPFKAPGSRYEITTPAAVAAVRGTRFRVSAEAGQAVMRSEVLQGEVGVSGAGVTQAVGANYGTLAEAGKAPLPPRRLLDPPLLSGLARELHQTPASFDWPAVEGATRYRAQLSTNEAFSTLMHDSVVSTPHAEWQGLHDGDYFLRIRAIDDIGLEGRDASHAFNLATQLPPPYATAPLDGMMQAAGSPPSFYWYTVGGAHSYRFQLSSQTNFATLLIDEVVNATRFTPAHDMDAGRYYWRLASRNSRGQEGDFGVPRGFIILPPSSGR